ncbi:hypothetical protein [Solicola sp. PLA-1-18]|uniref:hypothetical protein n=1 Tax=Solicola sp. PLA-1-18 TaxID=3380532 RepID=UPI003B7E7647
MTRMRLSPEHYDRIATDNLRQALAEATAFYWQKRADRFEAARPRPDDYVGHASPEQIAETDARIRAKADNCRAHADIAPRWVEQITDLATAEAAA